MGLITKTKRLWLPFLAMLVSASVTDRFLQSDNTLTGQARLDKSQHDVSASELVAICLNQAPDINIYPFNLPEIIKHSNNPETVTDIWVRIRNSFTFTEADPDRVRSHIDEYIKHPHLLNQVLQRGKPYLFHILARLEEKGMPAELALLPIVESGFDPFVTSPAGAAGIWQFMPETAAYVGLNQDWWYDGRRDIITSTEAALDYLGKLHKRFNNDWLLALAAYNAGGTRVARAIRNNRETGKPVDFWHLALPSETRSYVPRLIALRAIIENPRDYNISLPPLLDTRFFSAVNIRGQIELKVAAQLAEIPLDILQRLNPGYGRSITSPGTNHTLLFPKSVAHVFRERIARLPDEQRVKSIRHRIRIGDNLSTIAQQYRTTVSVLRKANSLKGSTIIAGEFLVVPAVEKKDSIEGATYAVLM